ncbi:type IV pilus modification protein PilV [Pseudomonas sp. MT3]|nr:type IV pilus modification protein PilV [uncultured Pseudomonas sp.]
MKRHQSGFSMIEVLISLVLICVGLMGMVALQSKAVPYTQDSVQRNNASMLASDLMELLRGNPSLVSSYLKKSNASFPDAPQSCTPTPSAATDRLGCWAARVKATLPGVDDSLLSSDFYVCRTITPGTPGSCASGSAIEIQVAWKTKAGECMDDNANNTVCHFRLRSAL